MTFGTGDLLQFIGNMMLLGVIIWQGRQIKGYREREEAARLEAEAARNAASWPHRSSP